MMEGIKQYQQIEDFLALKGRQYQGYYWLSDSNKPENVNGDFVINIQSQNPFIIEAMLYDEAENKAVMILHTGRYQITEYDMTILSKHPNIIEEISYMPHKLGAGKVKFKRIWKPENDPFCEDMEILKLYAVIFNGFA